MKKAIFVGLIILIFVTSLVYLLKPISDYDFFWHIATGKWIVEHRELPSTDPFAYTTKPGGQNVYSTLTRYWLAQVLFYLVYSASGLNGIIALRFIMFGLFVFLICKRRGGSEISLFTGLLFIGIIVVFRGFPVERPHFFSFIFFALLLDGIDSYSVNKSSDGVKLVSKRLLYLPLLMLVWANMHMGFIAGQAVLITYLVMEGLAHKIPILGPSMEKRQYKQFVVIAIVAIMVSMINPNTYKGFHALFYAKETMSGIPEWDSTIKFYRSIFTPQLVLYWLLLLFCIFVVIFRIVKREFYMADAAILAGLGYFSFTTIRYVPFFIVFAIPFLATFFRKESIKTLHRLIILLVSLSAFVYFLIGQNDIVYIKNIKNFKTSNWIISSFPEKAVEFIKENDLRGNMFNTYDWGGYLIWKLGPERKVFIDNRVIDRDMLREAAAINAAITNPPLLGKPYYKALLDGYNINFVITKLYNVRLQMLPLAAKLITDPEWIPVYEGSNAIIFVKNKPANSTVIRKFSHVQNKIVSSQIQQIDNMIRRSPGHVGLYLLKGDLYILINDIENARTSYREALKLFPDNEKAQDKIKHLEKLPQSR